MSARRSRARATPPALAAGRWPLVGAATMRALDRHTIEALGVSSELLMESAGRAVVEVCLREFARTGGEVCVVCGVGNNGGDGLVVARHLQLLGVPVRAALLGDAKALRGDAAANCARARACGVALGGPRWRAPVRGVIVDAIFGTGLSRRVEGPEASSIRRIVAAREAGRCVISVDLPSGLDADTGQPLGASVAADVTVTLGLPKPGLALEPGRTLAGEVRVARIGIADTAPGTAPDAELWCPLACADALPARPSAGHKGSFGHVLIAAGSEGKSGAAVLAAAGAARAGAGLVTIACPAGLNDVLEQKCTEAMTAPVADTPARAFASEAEDALFGLAEERDVLVLGPGIGRSRETQALVGALVKRVERPLVLDADGLFAFGSEPESLKGRRAASILTPHPGEAARLLGGRASEVNRDRIGAARALALRSGAVVLLKGAASVVADPDGRVAVNPTGGPALGSGGTGDVLAGVCGALLAQGCEPFEAAAAGAWVHGAAGDALEAQLGSAGVLASEVAESVPAILDALRADRGEPAAGTESSDDGRTSPLLLAFPGAGRDALGSARPGADGA